jgi:hypothetical protein
LVRLKIRLNCYDDFFQQASGFYNMFVNTKRIRKLPLFQT